MVNLAQIWKRELLTWTCQESHLEPTAPDPKNNCTCINIKCMAQRCHRHCQEENTSYHLMLRENLSGWSLDLSGFNICWLVHLITLAGHDWSCTQRRRDLWICRYAAFNEGNKTEPSTGWDPPQDEIKPTNNKEQEAERGCRWRIKLNGGKVTVSSPLHTLVFTLKFSNLFCSCSPVAATKVADLFLLTSNWVLPNRKPGDHWSDYQQNVIDFGSDFLLNLLFLRLFHCQTLSWVSFSPVIHIFSLCCFSRLGCQVSWCGSMVTLTDATDRHFFNRSSGYFCCFGLTAITVICVMSVSVILV